MSRHHPAAWVTCFLVATTVGCVREAPRYEVLSGGEGLHVLVRGPRLPLDGPAAPRLVPIGEIDGSTFPFDPPIWKIGGISSDGQGRIFLADRGHGHIVVTDVEGRYLGRIGSKGPGPFEFQPVTILDLKPIWIPSLGWLATVDGIWKIIFFEPDGTPMTARITDGGLVRRMMDVAPMRDGLATIMRSDPPLRLFDMVQGTDRGIGRLLTEDDARWPKVAEAVAAEQITELLGTVMVGNARLPRNIGTSGDSLAIHDFGLYTLRNGYRAWDMRTGGMAWQIDLELGDFEPPTTYNYTTSGENEMMSWGTDIPQVQPQTFVESIQGLEGRIFVVLCLRGDGSRSEPDHRLMRDPQSVLDQDGLGLQEMPYRGAVEVLTGEPDLLAHLPFPLDGPLTQAWVMEGPVVIVALTDPVPNLQLYRIEGLTRN
jgi:hypothetical protein